MHCAFGYTISCCLVSCTIHAGSYAEFGTSQHASHEVPLQCGQAGDSLTALCAA